MEVFFLLKLTKQRRQISYLYFLLLGSLGTGKEGKIMLITDIWKFLVSHWP